MRSNPSCDLRQANRLLSNDIVTDRVAFLRAHVVKPYLEDLASLGLLIGNSASSTMEQALERYERVLRLSVKGASCSVIAAEVGIGERTVSSWIKGERLPSLLRTGEVERRTRNAFPFHVPRVESEAFAYLLGTYCGSVRPGHAIYHFRPEVRCQEIAQRISAGFEYAVESKAKVFQHHISVEPGVAPYYEVNCLSLPLSRHMNTVTQANTRVPWEHLGSDSERRAFIRGVFDLNSSVSVKSARSLSVQKTGGEGLIIDIAHVLMRVNIVPRVRLGKKPTLYINEVSDLRLFSEQIGLSDPIQQQRLTQIASHVVSRTTYGAEDYYRAKSYWETNPELSNLRVAQATGVSHDAVRSWRDRKITPKEIIRTNELMSLLNHREKNVDLICLIFRHGGLTSAQSRDAASWASERQVREVIDLMTQEGIDTRTNPELFYNMLQYNAGVNEPVEEINDLKLPKPEETLRHPPSPFVDPASEQNGLSKIRAEFLSGKYDSLNYIEPLRELLARAPTLSYPCFTFEKFMQIFAPKNVELTRTLILALLPAAQREEYRLFLIEDGLLPEVASEIEDSPQPT